MNDFMQDNTYYIGANYWASHASINMWAEWDKEAVESDFRRLAEYGVRFLRMFLLWPDFQPLKAIYANERIYEYRMMPGEKPLPDTEAGRAGVSEEACAHFAELCGLADKYGIKLIVGLLTGHMSFRFYWPEAFEGKNFLTDPTVIKWEIRFVRYFVKRFRDEPSIVAWDLGNECRGYGLGGVNPDQSYVWTQCIASAIRESDPTRPVVSGYDHYTLDTGDSFNIREQSELVDINTTHPYQIFSATSIDALDTMRGEIDPAVRATLYESLGGKPTFVEEVGSIGYTNCSETTEAAFLRTMLWSTWAQNNRGLFWWCAFDQGKFDYAPYDWNNYGSDYGLFREDGSPKPVALEMKKFDQFLSSFDHAVLPQHTTEAVCIISRELRDHLKTLDSAFILAKQANIDITFAHAEDKLPDAPLYIFPSVHSPKPIFHHRLNELLERVRGGATLYLSLGDTLFRRIPELTGLTIASRERGNTDGNVVLDGVTYPLASAYKYTVESIADSCEVLASTAEGRPIYVRNRYGKGWIYFLLVPLESMLADRAGIFNKPDALPYCNFYKKFAASADRRCCESANPRVLLTEHILDENRRLVVAVNYANRPSGRYLTLREGWKLAAVHHGGADAIPANDAAVLELTR